jgi:hypothetical protein
MGSMALGTGIVLIFFGAGLGVAAAGAFEGASRGLKQLGQALSNAPSLIAGFTSKWRSDKRRREPRCIDMRLGDLELSVHPPPFV